MILSCWIVDDEPLALSLLESYVNKTPFLKLTGKFSNAIRAKENLDKESIDIIFLDIQMPELNGMEFAQILPTHTKLIFTTAFSEYALDGYKVNAIDYLLKPFSYADFLTAAQKVYNWFETIEQARQEIPSEEQKAIYVKSEYRLVQILFDDIDYVEGLKDYVKFYMSGECKPILSLMSMKSLEDLLPRHRFVRVHRSYIVQLSKIESFNRNRLVIGAKEIPIGETYKKDFFDKL